MTATTLRPARCAPSQLPDLAESVRYVQALGRPTAADVLDRARQRGRPAIQPRCGVGDHTAMTELLRSLEAGAAPDLLTVTVDAHTRLLQFDHAQRALHLHPEQLNGYPLVTHGWQRGRELVEAVGVPLQVRHGSPDPRVLFGTALAAGLTAFEGGGISYNLPYCKDVPLAASLAAWREVDAQVGEAARSGLVIDREMFGTLTAVLMPPSISLAVGVIEAACAIREGVRCVSIAYPQGGHLWQDVAALSAVPLLAARYLPSDVAVHAVLHAFMGVFPRERAHADELIVLGGLVARLGAATKLVTKTTHEAFGIPDAAANIDGMRLAAAGGSPLLMSVSIDQERVGQELEWIMEEVAELVDPVLAAPDPYEAVVDAFACGALDVPFSASRYARGEVVPGRDAEGAIRYVAPGGLTLSDRTLARHARLVDGRDPTQLFAMLSDDIHYFPRLFGETAPWSAQSDEWNRP